MRHWNKLDKLEKGLVKMWEKFPQNLEYPSELARLMMMQGQWEKAEKVLRTILGQWKNPQLEKCLLGFCLKMKNLQLNQGMLILKLVLILLAVRCAAKGRSQLNFLLCP